MDPATRILLTLDSHLSQRAEIRLMGGAAMILAYGRRRMTEDVDLLQDQAELEFLAEERDFGHGRGFAWTAGVLAGKTASVAQEDAGEAPTVQVVIAPTPLPLRRGGSSGIDPLA